MIAGSTPMRSVTRRSQVSVSGRHDAGDRHGIELVEAVGVEGQHAR